MNGFAAFIMTFRRNIALKETIEKLFEQTCPPQKILIIDNDPKGGASEVVDSFRRSNLAYHSMGYNAGPAGAARAGLKILSEEGYEFIAWIDDDDPPFFKDTTAILLKLIQSGSNIGCVGSVGQYFDMSRALIKRVPDTELATEGPLSVDNIAGNMTKIIRADAIRKNGILPDESFFFGFEELEFDLNLKKAGFIIACDRQLYKRHRVFHHREGFQVRHGEKKSERGLAREYYSTRNMLSILRKHKSYKGILRFGLRVGFKMIRGFRFGWRYGIQNLSILISAIIDFVKGRSGMRNILSEKSQ
jgi:GT2 family glycosyltransferase